MRDKTQLPSQIGFFTQDRIPHIAVTTQLKGLGKQQREKTLRTGRTQSSFQQHKQECFQRSLPMSPF